MSQGPQAQMQQHPPTIQVVLADDHPIVRSGIRALLGAIRGVNVIAEAGNGNELLSLLETVRPDVVVTDISMPGLDGIAALEQIRSRHPQIRIIVLSMHEEPELVRRCIAGGASAYLRKDADEFELASALQSVIATGSYISAAVARVLMKPAEPSIDEELTPRQIEILQLLTEGRTAKEIGFALGLSPKTVDAHRARIMDRLGVHDLPGLTLYAVRKGLLQLT